MGINKIKRESDTKQQVNIDDEFDMSDYCQHKIYDIIQQKLKDAIPVNTELRTILDSSIKLLNSLTIVLNKVTPCFPKHFKIFKIHKDCYLNFIYQRIKPFLNENHLKEHKENLILFASWLDNFETILSKLGIDLYETSISPVN